MILLLALALIETATHAGNPLPGNPTLRSNVLPHDRTPNYKCDTLIRGNPPSFLSEIPTDHPERRRKHVDQLRVMSWNINGIVFFPGKESDPRHPNRTSYQKNRFQIESQVRTIQSQNPDIVLVQGVEIANMLVSMNRLSFEDGQKYFPLVFAGNDPFSHLGVLIARDLPYQVEIETHRGDRWTDFSRVTQREVERGNTGPEVPLFTRDLPIITFYERNLDNPQEKGRPVLVVGNAHLKGENPSEQNDLARSGSKELRRAEVERTKVIFHEKDVAFGGRVPVVIGGVFGHALDDSDANDFSILNGSGLVDVLDGLEDRTTSCFFGPPGSSGDSSGDFDDMEIGTHSTDSILLSRSHRGRVMKAFVAPFVDSNGLALPRLPRTRTSFNRLYPSSHFPIVVDVRVPANPTPTE